MHAFAAGAALDGVDPALLSGAADEAVEALDAGADVDPAVLDAGAFDAGAVDDDDESSSLPHAAKVSPAATNTAAARRPRRCARTDMLSPPIAAVPTAFARL